MVKIKGWTKIRDNDWMHETARSGSGYDSRGNMYPHKELNIRHTSFGYIILGSGVGSLSRTFGSLKKAQEFVIDYMRKHPNG